MRNYQLCSIYKGTHCVVPKLCPPPTPWSKSLFQSLYITSVPLVAASLFVSPTSVICTRSALCMKLWPQWSHCSKRSFIWFRLTPSPILRASSVLISCSLKQGRAGPIHLDGSATTVGEWLCDDWCQWCANWGLGVDWPTMYLVYSLLIRMCYTYLHVGGMGDKMHDVEQLLVQGVVRGHCTAVEYQGKLKCGY